MNCAAREGPLEEKAPWGEGPLEERVPWGTACPENLCRPTSVLLSIIIATANSRYAAFGEFQATAHRNITGPGISDGGKLGLICIMVQTDMERK